MACLPVEGSAGRAAPRAVTVERVRKPLLVRLRLIYNSFIIRISLSFWLRCWYPSPVGGLKEKKVKWKRAEGVEGPSPGPVFGGNGRALMGSKGPYLLSGEILIP